MVMVMVTDKTENLLLTTLLITAVNTQNDFRLVSAINPTRQTRFSLHENT